MEASKNIKYYNELDDEGHFEIAGIKPRKSTKSTTKKVSLAVQKFLENQDDNRKAIKFTYKAARFEESWLLDSLGYFFDQKWISDVLRKIKAGKEASVYLCKSGDLVNTPYIAAKVYRPRMLRNLRQDYMYREGRTILDEDGHEVHDSQSLHAIITRTKFGEQVRHQSWIAHEYTALQALFESGANVPQPYEMAHNAILMGYVGDLEMPAPALNEITLGKQEAQFLYGEVINNIHILLANHQVHGDLSAYNILYWDGEITLIDFPQVISPDTNRNAFSIFSRDIQRLCEYFLLQGLRLDIPKVILDLWTSHGFQVRYQEDAYVSDQKESHN